jgi:uncharacterized protein YbjT (DUF2867 family)
MILVTGAGGKTGRAIIGAVAKRGGVVRALIHREAQAAMVKAAGAQQTCVGDMRSESDLRLAMHGIRVVYHVCPNAHPDELAIGRAAIAAASAAGIERFVYHSVLHPHTEAMPHHWQKLRVEESLFESRLPFTILQPTAYMQNLLAAWKTIVAHGVYTVPYPVETRLSLVDLDDVAEAAAIVLTDFGHTDATYELVGEAAMPQAQVAEVLSQQLRRPVRVEAETHAAWEERARSASMDPYKIGALLKMFGYYARCGLHGNPNVLGWLLGRPPTTLGAFVERTLRAPTSDA